MERIMYRKTLDVHKNGIQFMLQGFETADNMSRVIEISLMASGDAIDFPLENVEAIMYVTTPNATEPSINKCTIKDNKVVYEVLPIVEEGVTTMQLKFIETSTDGATGILASPKFAVEVTKSDTDDESVEQTTTFTALEDAMAKAKAVYDERFLRMELSNDCVFRAYYADGTVYETDLLKKLFHNGNVLLSESYAHGGTGIRTGENTDNSMYYSNVSKSEALNAKNVMENSEEILEEARLHGVYTAFKVDFESGEVEYVSPSYKFRINLDTGELDAEGETFSYEDEIGRIVAGWLEKNGASISSLTTTVSEHTEKLSELTTTTQEHGESISTLGEDFSSYKEEITPINKGGTGATTAEKARVNLDAGQPPLIVTLTGSEVSFAPNGADKTVAEIYKAASNGRTVIGIFAGKHIFRLSQFCANYVIFKGTVDFGANTSRTRNVVFVLNKDGSYTQKIVRDRKRVPLWSSTKGSDGAILGETLLCYGFSDEDKESWEDFTIYDLPYDLAEFDTFEIVYMLCTGGGELSTMVCPYPITDVDGANLDGITAFNYLLETNEVGSYNYHYTRKIHIAPSYIRINGVVATSTHYTLSSNTIQSNFTTQSNTDITNQMLVPVAIYGYYKQA